MLTLFSGIRTASRWRPSCRRSSGWSGITWGPSLREPSSSRWWRSPASSSCTSTTSWEERYNFINNQLKHNVHNFINNQHKHNGTRASPSVRSDFWYHILGYCVMLCCFVCQENACARCLLKTCICCLWCLEKCLNYLNQVNAHLHTSSSPSSSSLFLLWHPSVPSLPRMHMQPQPSTAPVSARLRATPLWSWWRTHCASQQSTPSETSCSSWGRWEESDISNIKRCRNESLASFIASH